MVTESASALTCPNFGWSRLSVADYACALPIYSSMTADRCKTRREVTAAQQDTLRSLKSARGKPSNINKPCQDDDFGVGFVFHLLVNLSALQLSAGDRR
jgi:hypothetical protein